MPTLGITPETVVLSEPPIGWMEYPVSFTERYEVYAEDGSVLFHDPNEKTCREWIEDTFIRVPRPWKADLYVRRDSD